jgi:glycerol-3-phosphate acyltransferase PlsX
MPGSGAPIVLDAMGGDHAPREQVAGAVAAVREHGVQVVLAGAVDVVVTDGFTGNVALKTIEGSLRLAVTETRAALAAGPAGAVAQFANRGRLRRLAERFDADSRGGAVLLGLGGTVVIAHGSARARAITRACLLARDLARAGITGQAGQAVTGPPAGALS